MRKPLMTTLAAALAVALPAVAQARPVSMSIPLKNYGGDGAYLAVYVTDAKGAYVRTLWVAGGKAKYYKHLADWNRLSAGVPTSRSVCWPATTSACGSRHHW